MGHAIKAQNDCRSVGQLKLQCIANATFFLVSRVFFSFTLTNVSLTISRTIYLYSYDLFCS